MKKFYLILMVLMGVAVLSFATLSCSKEALDPSQQEQNQKEETVKEEPSGDTPVPEGMIRLTFGVSQEGDASANEGDDTKTSWDGTNHAWSDNDQIRIFWGTGAEDYKDATVKNNQVDVVVGDAEYYYAVYPATAADDFVLNADGSSISIDVAIPKVQDGTFASANKMVAKTSKAVANLAFKNVTHIVKFHMTESSNYDNLEFTSNGASKLIVDVFGVSFDGDNVVIGDATTKFSTFGNGYTHSKYVQMNSLEGNKDYYFAVVPGSDFNTGLGVKAHIKGDLSSDEYNLGAISKAKITTDRNSITNIGNLDPKIHADWFIKESVSGDGDGSSWDNAGDLSLFLKLVKDKTNDSGVNSTWRLHNAKIHFAEGTYDIYAANEGTLSFNDSAWDMKAAEKYQLKDLNLTIDGGYPSSNTGTSLDLKDPVNHPTKWQTAQTDDTYRVFEAAGCRMSGWTFDGITFEANGDHILPGDVFHFDSTTSGTVNFKNCYFKDFVGTSINGGPIYVEGTGAVVMTFNGCTFSGNSCNTGGTAYFNNPNAIISITDCTFSGNSSVNNGGAIRASVDSLSISGGSFDSNKSTKAGSKGGAIYVGDGTTVTIDGTTFSNNIGGTWGDTSSGRGGALLFASSAAVTVKNAKFSGNKSSNGGAIYTEAGTVNIDNATFTENSATNGGAIRTEGACHLTIDKCSFTLNTSAGGEGGALDIMTGTTDVTLKNSSISNCSAKKGGAICISQKESTTYIPVSLYNTSIINNTATAGAGGIMSTGKNDLIMVNCTVSSNSGTNGGGIYVTRYNSNSSYITRLSMVSCTVTNNTASTGCGGIYRDTYGQVVDVYNCIISGNTGTDTNNDVRNAQLLYHVKNSVVADKSYISADRVNKNAPVGGFQWRKSELSTPSAFDIATMLSSLSTDVHSVLNVSENPAKMCGMSYEDLSSLSLSATPTQEVDKSFFTKDQKGNSREGKTTMGAYVGE